MLTLPKTSNFTAFYSQKLCFANRLAGSLPSIFWKFSKIFRFFEVCSLQIHNDIQQLFLRFWLEISEVVIPTSIVCRLDIFHFLVKTRILLATIFSSSTLLFLSGIIQIRNRLPEFRSGHFRIFDVQQNHDIMLDRGATARWWRGGGRDGEAVDTVYICGGDDKEHSLPAHKMIS